MPKTEGYDYVIVGGGIAGTTAAETIRQYDHSGSILIISKETDVLYSRVLLPSYIRGIIPREKAFLRSKEEYDKKNISLELGQYILRLDLEAKEIVTSEERAISYNKLLIATGGLPRSWNPPGLEPGEALRFQTIEDADRIKKTFLEPHESGIVVGGGFISLEFIETAVKYGSRVDVVLKGRKMFGEQFDAKGWEILEKNFESHGVVFHYDTEIVSVKKDQNVYQALTDKGETIGGTWIASGIGIERNYGPFQATGVKINKGILTDEFLKTDREDVWAAGDIAEFNDVLLGGKRMLGNWTNAFLQGRAAGFNMAHEASQHKPFQALSTYSITNLGYQFTFLGITEREEGGSDIIRVWEDGRSYERLFIKDNTIRGAILVGRFADKVALAKLIENKKDISASLSMIADPSFNVATLV